MRKFKIAVQQYERIPLYGLWMDSSDRTIAKDIPSLSKQYHAVVGKAEDSIMPFYVLSKDYDEATGKFRLFIGSDSLVFGLEEFILEEGRYAKIIIRPKFGFLWGLAIGEAKRYFYTRWLPESGFKARNMEYEHHTEKSVGKGATVDLIFAISE